MKTGALLLLNPSSSPGHVRGTVMPITEVLFCVNYSYLLF